MLFKLEKETSNEAQSLDEKDLEVVDMGLLPSSISSSSSESFEEATDETSTTAVSTAATSASIKESDHSSDITSPEEINATPAMKLVFLLEEKLPEIFTKQKTDDFIVTFCYSNSKSARKSLIQHMCKIPRGRSELIPNYARVIASLNKIFGDVGDPIVDSLFKDFYGMYKTKSQMHLESKLKNIRYIGELIKFKVAPPITAFKIFKLLFSDFTGHNVEILSTLIETCGRYLYLYPFTSERMQEVLDTMNRLKKAKFLDMRHQTLIESAYFSVIPPEPRAKRVKKALTTVQKYIHYLIKSKLDKSCVGMQNIFIQYHLCNNNNNNNNNNFKYV